MIKKVLIVFAILVIAGLVFGSKIYKDVYGSNTKDIESPVALFIGELDGYEEVKAQLEKMEVLESISSFDYVAELKSYPELVKPGRYLIKDGMSNNELVNMLRIGEQSAVRLSFNNARTIAELAGQVSDQLESDSLAFLKAFENDSLMRFYGFSKRTYLSMFIPNTYEINWNTSPEKFIKRMAVEFKSFWNDGRISKAKSLGLSQSEVVTLASIVQAEQSLRPDEHKRIAGLYINRLKKGIPLQSDPTVKYAVGDFGLKRVLNVHLKADSPYNTYKHPGLPPGPITMPDISTVDAVLSYESHDFIFMCAKADRSGYHHFAKTLREHNRYAKAFQRSLDERKIYR